MIDRRRCRSAARQHGRARNRWPAALAFAAAVVAGVAIPATPALAHDSEDLASTNYRSAVVSLEPAPAGTSARVIEVGNRLELTNRSGQDVVVVGYEGEPMLRVGPAGVFENRRSPSVFTSATRPLAVPADADPEAKPQWRRISQGVVARWHDHRADPGQAAKAGAAAWAIPLRQEAQSITLVGSLRYVPGPNPLPWLGAATLLLAGTAWAAVLRPRRWRPLVAMALGATIVLDAVHNLGRFAASYGPLSNRLFDLFFPLLGWLAAGVALRRLARRPEELPSLAGYAGLVLFLMGGLGGIEALSNSQLAFAYPTVLARVAVMAALGVGGGLLVALVYLITAPLPTYPDTPPSGEAEDRTGVGRDGEPADASPRTGPGG